MGKQITKKEEERNWFFGKNGLTFGVQAAGEKAAKIMLIEDYDVLIKNMNNELTTAKALIEKQDETIKNQMALIADLEPMPELIEPTDEAKQELQEQHRNTPVL